jgi:hypothetical protein
MNIYDMSREEIEERVINVLALFNKFNELEAMAPEESAKFNAKGKRNLRLFRETDGYETFLTPEALYIATKEQIAIQFMACITALATRLVRKRYEEDASPNKAAWRRCS